MDPSLLCGWKMIFIHEEDGYILNMMSRNAQQSIHN